MLEAVNLGRRRNSFLIILIVTNIIYPFLHHAGVLWTINKSMPAQEHFISNLIRQKIISSIDALPLPADDAPSILMFLFEGEEHEIGLLLASFIAKDLGWRVYYLGQNVPAANIVDVIMISQPEAMMTMSIVQSQAKIAHHIETIAEITNIPLLISGNLENIDSLSDIDIIKYIPDPESFITFLNTNDKQA